MAAGCAASIGGNPDAATDFSDYPTGPWGNLGPQILRLATRCRACPGPAAGVLVAEQLTRRLSARGR
jgi:hypothetical protein